MDDLVAAAVIDNARWCHLIGVTHGIIGRFDEDAWVSSRRTPPMYPDAVTLRADCPAESLLSRVDSTPGCSIKDSFASLDLSAAGFVVLFDAAWIQRAAGRPPAESLLEWGRVERPTDLRAWAADHRGGATFVPALLDEPSVTILAGRDRAGRLMAGAIATEGEAAVGVSNVFAVDTVGGSREVTFADAFAGASAAIADRFPDRPIVGYLSSETLAAARSAGFQEIGPLRVWLRDGS